MTTLTTRNTKGSTLTYNELDANFSRNAQAKSGTYTVAESDNNDTIQCSGTFTISLPDAATIAAASDTGDFEVTIKNSGSGVVTVGRITGADTIDGTAANFILNPTQSCTFKVNQAGTGYNIICSHDSLTKLYDANGNEVVILESVASAVNEVTILNAATTVNPRIQSSGEANTGLIIADSNDNEVIIAESVASAVNEITITNAATGNDPTIAATGGDTNIDLVLSGKGSGTVIASTATITTLTSTTANITTANIASRSGTSRRVLLDAQEPSAVSSVSFTTAIDSTYRMYEFVFYHITPVTDGASLYAIISQNGGSSYFTTNYNNGTGSITDAQFNITGAASNVDTEGGISGSLAIYDVSRTDITKHISSVVIEPDQTNPNMRNRIEKWGAFVGNTAAINAIRFAFTSGNIAGGRIELYGVS